MFYETAQTIGPGWHGKSFKPSHYDDLSWSNPSSAARHFRSPGSSPTFRRRIITHDNDDDDAEPHMFHRRSPTFERKFFKDVWDDRPGREDIFEDRPRMFKRNWDKDPGDFESSLRRERDFRDEFDHHQDDDDDYEARVHHIPIMVERLREKMNDAKSSYRNRCPSPPPPSMEQQNFVDESDEWLQHHMNRLKQNFDSGFSTMQNRHNRHRLPKVDLNSRPRAFTSPILDWGPESVHTLPTRKLHGRIFTDEKRNPKSVFRSYSETHEDIPREHPTAARSHSDSHCPKTTYVTKVSVNMPPENCEKPSEEVDDHPPEPPQRRSRYRQRKQENAEQEQKVEQPQEKQSDEPNTQRDQVDSKLEDAPKPCDSKPRRGSKDGRGANALLQISSVLQNVEDLLHHVEAYNGNGRDKQFRFLDEMLTRCMLRLDDVDTDGLEDVRSARKAAVRQVQACIEKLESRAILNGKKNTSEGPDSDKSQPEEPPREEEPTESEITSDAASSKEVEQTRL